MYLFLVSWAFTVQSAAFFLNPPADGVRVWLLVILETLGSMLGMTKQKSNNNNKKKTEKNNPVEYTVPVR